MIKYEIKLDDAGTMFGLYEDGKLLGYTTFVGEILDWIGTQHDVDLDDCLTETQALYKLNLFSFGKYSVEAIE